MTAHESLGFSWGVYQVWSHKNILGKKETDLSFLGGQPNPALILIKILSKGREEGSWLEYLLPKMWGHRLLAQLLPGISLAQTQVALSDS